MAVVDRARDLKARLPHRTPPVRPWPLLDPIPLDDHRRRRRVAFVIAVAVVRRATRGLDEVVLEAEAAGQDVRRSARQNRERHVG